MPEQKEVRHSSDGVRAWQKQCNRIEYIRKGKIHTLKPLLCPLILCNLLKARYPHWEQGSPGQSYQHSVRLNQKRLLCQTQRTHLLMGLQLQSHKHVRAEGRPKGKEAEGPSPAIPTWYLMGIS